MAGEAQESAVLETAELKLSIGLVITSLSGIDPSDGSFHLTGYFWVVDPSSTFEAERELRIHARRVQKELVLVEDFPGGRYTALHFEATIEQDFDTRNFPFDRQTLVFFVETDRPANKAVLVPDEADSILADFAVVSGWIVTGLTMQEYKYFYSTGFGGRETWSSSRLRIEIDIERERSALVIEKFIGLTVALLIATLIYFVPKDQLGVRVTMVTSAIFAAVGNRYTLDTVMGTDSTFGLADKISLIVFGAIYAALVVSIATSYLLRYNKVANAGRFNRWAGVFTVSITWFFAVYVVIMARV